MLAKTIAEVRDVVTEKKAAGLKVGLVPTMGFLHEGHLSLIRKAKEETDFVVVSVFVNPTQFGPNEDFESYPREPERDYQLSLDAGANLIFNPEVEEMYPEPGKTVVEVTGLTANLCGASRPGHFNGVSTVVSKLFNIVLPDRAYFGQKDAQQVAVIKQMVRNLNFPLQIVACPIVREKDGLAMSSRNTYLSSEERISALRLSQALFAAEEMIIGGERDAAKVRKYITDHIEEDPRCLIDYVKTTDFGTLEDVETITGEVLIAIAVKIGKTRLIDNVVVEVK